MMTQKKIVTVALMGNPNSGKTSIFNMLTGTHQHVANYPGVTVEKKQGSCTYKDYRINIIDLPGTYSLTAYSIEELIARNFIINDKPDVVIDVIDSSNIERNLYLTTQLMEANVPLILAFNMSDIAKQRGLEFDLNQLSNLLEAVIIPTIGNKTEGKIQLLDAIVEIADKPRRKRTHKVGYGAEIEEEISKIQKLLVEKEKDLVAVYDQRWLAVKLLEQDKEMLTRITDKQLLETVSASVNHLRNIFADEPEIVMADRRYGFISGACQETIKNTVELRHDMSDTIDAIVTHRVFGLPIFLFLMYLVFMLTFKIGRYPMEWLDYFFSWLSTIVEGLWPAGSQSLIKSLMVDGIISGVGGVLIFLPNILILFLAIALLEDSGYMSRAAFVMDRIMHKIGLHGKSFIPMLIGFGCSVPAIMATRILENKRNRLTTIMIIPFMSCGGRFAVYALLVPAFFPDKWQGPMLWLIYIIGIMLGVIAAKVLRLTILRGETTPFVMELPPYRRPTFKATFIHTSQRAWMYLKKAGTVILAASIILWVMMNFPRPDIDKMSRDELYDTTQTRLEYSVVGRIGKVIEPVIKPLGFDWKIGTSLIGATAAKEIFVSQLAIVYSEEEKDKSLAEVLSANYSGLTGFCILLFTLISSPCIATIAITKQETNSWFWALFQFAGLTIMAYIVTLLVYQTGSIIL